MFLLVSIAFYRFFPGNQKEQKLSDKKIVFYVNVATAVARKFVPQKLNFAWHRNVGRRRWKLKMFVIPRSRNGAKLFIL